jgi:DNA-binding NtrC family response regulator
MFTTRRVSDALRLLQEGSFKAVLLDYHLPGDDPWAIVEAAAAVRPAIPVVLVTGQSSEFIASEALRRGISDYGSAVGDARLHR